MFALEAEAQREDEDFFTRQSPLFESVAEHHLVVVAPPERASAWPEPNAHRLLDSPAMKANRSNHPAASTGESQGRPGIQRCSIFSAHFVGTLTALEVIRIREDAPGVPLFEHVVGRLCVA